MFEHERDALRATLKLSRPTLRGTMLVAALYAGQAVVCIVLLKQLYAWQHWPAVIWAMVSTILALQPGLSQSVVTSIIRILANTVGAGVALGVAQIHMPAEIQLVLSLIIVVFICEGLRLSLALRTACVAVIIVLTVSEGHVLNSGAERFAATVVGCMMALLVQLMTDVVWKMVPGHRKVIVPMKS